MSTLTPKIIITPQQLTNSAATYYTVPSSTSTVIRRITLCNVTGGAVTVTLHIVPSAGSASSSNKFLDVYSIAANTTDSPPELEGLVLTAGYTIQALASANTSINIIAAGTEIA